MDNFVDLEAPEPQGEQYNKDESPIIETLISVLESNPAYDGTGQHLMTREEIEDSLLERGVDFSTRKIRKVLRELKKRGLLIVGKTTRRNVVDVFVKVPGYSIVKPGDESDEGKTFEDNFTQD